MRAFMDDDFLLQSESARRLYHDYAARMPIFDYHCHLSPQLIAQDHHFSDLAEAWLAGDHYKWRAMRTNGVHERFVTGDAAPRDKFQRWAETVPATIGNPLYHWTHLELRRHFGIDTLLNSATAEEVWHAANAELSRREMGTRGILALMDVRYVGTTDDPVDSLEFHRAIAAQAESAATDLVVLPSFRPDKAYAVGDPVVYRAYLERLAEVAGLSAIRSFDDLREALRRRIDFFHDHGCRISDHALVLPVCREFTEAGLNESLARLMEGRPLEREATEAFVTAVLDFLAREYHARDWAFQLHIGAIRNNNSRMFRALGPDTGFDSMADGEVALPLARLLDRLDRDDKLPRTVLYVLNPRDNDLAATMIGNFQDGSVPGKLQFGS